MTIQASPRRLGAQLKAGLAAAAAAQLRTHMCKFAAIMGSSLPPHLQLVEASRREQLVKAVGNAAARAESRKVTGYVHSMVSDGTSAWANVPHQLIADALPTFLKAGRLTESARPFPAGKVTSAVQDETGLYVEASVTNDQTWQRVSKGAYAGLALVGSTADKLLTIKSIHLVDAASPEFSTSAT